MKLTTYLRSPLVFGLVLILLLSACGTKTPEDSTASPTSVATSASPSTSSEVSPTNVPTTMPTSPTEVPVGDPSEPVTVLTPESPAMCQPAPLPELPVREADETDYVKGASLDDAEMVIYEYSDFQCPGCSGMYPILQTFLDMNPDVALVYRHFPLDFHPNAQLTSEAAEAAGAQGKFWEMHNLLFDRVSEWVGLEEEAALLEQLSAYAEDLDLDVKEFDAALKDGTYTAKVDQQYAEARELGLPGTPSFIFDNVLFPSDIGLSLQGLIAFNTIIENQDELFFAGPPDITIEDGANYVAILKTTRGDIRVNLLTGAAPVSVNSFIFLAQEQWYNGSEFFFVRDNFVAVTGDPTNSTVGYPGYYCQGETQNNFDRSGLLGMLSNGQFFLTLGSDAAQLNGQFALIGQVTEGLEVLDALTRRVVGDPSAPAADVIESIQIIKQ